MPVVSFRGFAAPLLPPDSNHQENQDREADEQQDDRPGLFFPQLLKLSENFVHAKGPRWWIGRDSSLHVIL